VIEHVSEKNDYREGVYVARSRGYIDSLITST